MLSRYTKTDRVLWSAGIAFICFVLSFVWYVRSERQIDEAHHQRFLSMQLTTELKQSSDDLTRMVRTYAVTGNPIYKARYQEILSIRNGDKPRPDTYALTYWDLVLADDKRPAVQGAPIALLTRMQQAGVTEGELNELRKAKTRSDALAKLELDAMQLVDSSEPPNRQRAVELLHDDAYHAAKAGIMQPIAEVMEKIDTRTLEAVRAAEEHAFLNRIVFIVFGILTVWMQIHAYWRMRTALGGSVGQLRRQMARIGQGDFSATVVLPDKQKDSVYGWLLAMQERLRHADEQRRQSEDALRASELRFRSYFELPLVGIAITSPEMGWLEVNQRLCDLFGYPREELVTLTWTDITHPDDLARDVAEFERVLCGETDGYALDKRFIRKNGMVMYASIAVRCVRKSDGSPDYFVALVQDIDARKRSEDELRIAAATFDSQEGMMVTDAAGVILRVNRAFTDITGYSEEEVVGHTPKILQSGRHDKAFYQAMWDSILRTGVWQGEVWDKHKSGRIYPKWLTISAVKNTAGKVTHYVGAHYDISERKEAEEQINALAFYDQLTRLPNRTLLADRLKQTLAQCVRNRHYGALMFIDLDNFKTLNDTQGHDMGDLLLKQVAKRVQQSIREDDTVARVGGDEFVVIVSGLPDEAAEAARATEWIAQKILAAINQGYVLGNQTYHCGASIGVTLFSSIETPMDELMKQADLAMYRSKSEGRNQIRFFDPKMEADAKVRATLERDLRDALDKHQFLLHYQPQVVADGRVTGAEALVRWQHPARGMVSPAEFIPAAESAQLIQALGRWVLKVACQTLATWANQPAFAALTIAVNISAYQLREDDFVNQVLDALKATGANPQRLKLELTESVLVDNIDVTIQKMYALKAIGVGFSLDDFGTGYSSLSYLKRLPLDQLKIDQSFVRDVLSDPNDAAIARTVVALAQSLGLNVIAEGVETQAQREFLAASGCYAYQGYLFSRPLPLAGFEEFAAKLSDSA